MLSSPNLKSHDLLLLCSGGPDSVFLFHQLKEKGLNFSVVHFQHHQRDSAEMDAEFVSHLCRAAGVPFFIVDLDFSNSKTNFQNQARRERYLWAKDWCQSKKSPLILTAHHLDDQIETLLFRLSRGAGLKGLAGIREQSLLWGVPVCRPLLHLSKSQILKQLDEHGWDYCVDESNASEKYERNKIRHQLLPKFSLEQKQNIAHLAEFLQQADVYFSTRACFYSKPSGILLRTEFDAWPEELQFRVIQKLVSKQGFEKQFEDKHFHMILKETAHLQLGDCEIFKDNQYLVFSHSKVQNHPEKHILAKISAKGSYYIGQYGLKLSFKKSVYSPNTQSKKRFYFHPSLAKQRLRVTGARLHETMQTYGHKRPQSLADLYQSHKIPLALRRIWPVLRNSTGQIVCVLGVAASSDYALQQQGDPALEIHSDFQGF